MTKVWTESKLKSLVLVFFVTALWDVILRNMVEGKIHFLGIENMKWVKVLKKYYEKHTILAATLLAGFVGAVAYAIYTYIVGCFNLNLKLYESGALVFVISGMLGLVMRFSGLFPVLNDYHYTPLDNGQSFLADATFGFISAATLVLIKEIPMIKNIVHG
jgi:hypothetical protein